MILTLDLPPEIETALAADARRKGTTPEKLVLQYLRQHYGLEPEPLAQRSDNSNGDADLTAMP